MLLDKAFINKIKENRDTTIFCGILIVVFAIFIASRLGYWIIFNFTHSLPETVFLYKADDMSFKRGGPIVIVAKGLPNVPDGARLIKRVSGFPHDVIMMRGNELFINNKLMLNHFDESAYWGKIHKIDNQVIPENCYFVNGVSAHSFDSRYKEVGLICKERIVGKAWALF